MNETIIMQFPSSYQWLNMIDLICGEVTSEMGFSHSALNEISISVIEACTNALEHGNKSVEGTLVSVIFHRKQDQMVVEVFDSGEGFDYEDYLQHIPDPSDIHHQRGRGIYIMKAMMDSLIFEKLPDRGMKVTLIKNVDDVE
ncbi:MAG: ATP-binding protein [Candidatus Krumholzibacteria bacterium]|nr:ATP-binding protein [Candidatus Krumholzibacteria bacterium]